MKKRRRRRAVKNFHHNLSKEYLLNSLNTTAQEKLDWLEEAYRFVCRAAHFKKQLKRRGQGKIWGENLSPPCRINGNQRHAAGRNALVLPGSADFPRAWEIGLDSLPHLLRIPDPKKRLVLIKRASQKNWTTQEVATAVREIQQKALPSTNGKKKDTLLSGKLVPKKGKFFIYRIVRPQNMHEGPGGESLDLGFKIRHEADFTGMRPKLGDLVQVVRTQKSAAGDRYKITQPSGLKPADLYTYKAKAQIFYDADTFWVDVDLGFHNWSEQKLRLRGIDALELGEGRGKKAAAYVKKVLSGVPFIVMTISGRDKFGRPLADVFYLPGTDEREKVLAEGKFLNQELLDLGLATQE